MNGIVWYSVHLVGTLITPAMCVEEVCVCGIPVLVGSTVLHSVPGIPSQYLSVCVIGFFEFSCTGHVHDRLVQ